MQCHEQTIHDVNPAFLKDNILNYIRMGVKGEGEEISTGQGLITMPLSYLYLDSFLEYLVFHIL